MLEQLRRADQSERPTQKKGERSQHSPAPSDASHDRDRSRSPVARPPSSASESTSERSTRSTRLSAAKASATIEQTFTCKKGDKRAKDKDKEHEKRSSSKEQDKSNGPKEQEKMNSSGEQEKSSPNKEQRTDDKHVKTIDSRRESREHLEGKSKSEKEDETTEKRKSSEVSTFDSFIHHTFSDSQNANEKEMQVPEQAEIETRSEKTAAKKRSYSPEQERAPSVSDNTVTQIEETLTQNSARPPKRLRPGRFLRII